MDHLKNNILNLFQDIIFWKYQIDKKLFVLLSSASRANPIVNFERLFTDLVYAQSFFNPSDFTQFKLFIQDIRKGNNGQTLIKLLDLKGLVHWIRLGAYHDTRSNTTYGFIYDITSDLNKFSDKNNLSLTTTTSLKTGRTVKEAEGNYSDIFSRSIQQQIDESKDISELLKIIQENQSTNAPFDMIILLHINKQKRTVKIFLSDPKQQTQIPKSEVPYSDLLKTIMDTNKDSFLIAEDLILSDSPLDWAIFIPLGLKSYYTHPIIISKQLQGILYFGSFNQSFFTPINNTNYQPYINILIKKYQTWRKNN